MQSRKSCFNVTLYEKLLARFWPMWGSVTALASLVPLIFMLSLLRAGPIEDMLRAQVNMEEVYHTILTNVAPAFMLGYGVLCAMAVWNYLYQHRSVSLMHTLPVTRTNLFVTGCCAGLTFMLLPMAVAGSLLFVVTACFGLAAPVAFLECAAGLVLLALLNFGIATLCAMVTGHLVALPVFAMVANFLAVLLDLLMSTFTNMFFFGVNAEYTGAVEWLSPTVYIYQNVRSRNIWEEAHEIVGGKDNYYTYIVDVELEGLHILLIYGLIGVLLLALAWLIYQRRPSESAGDVVSLASLRPLFKLGVGVCVALSFGQLLYAIFSMVGDGDSLLRMGLCMFAAGTVGFWIADMLVQKSLRVWKTTAVGAGAMAVMAVAVCLVVRFDLFGVESYLPDYDEIEKVELRVNGISRETLQLKPGQDDDYIVQVMDIHRNIVENKEEILDLSGSRYENASYAVPYDPDSNEEIIFRTVRIIYDLKNGTEVERRYSVPFTRDLMADKTSYVARIAALYNDPTIQLKRIHYNEGYEIYWADMWSSNLDTMREKQELYEDVLKNMRETYMEKDEARILYAALVEDVVAGRWGFTDMLAVNSSKESWLEINFEMRKNVGRADEYGNRQEEEYDYISILYTPKMTAVHNALLQLGFPEEIMEEREDFLTEDEKKVLTSFDPNSMTVTTGSSFGVIGGADGPTAVFVTGG